MLSLNEISACWAFDDLGYHDRLQNGMELCNCLYIGPWHNRVNNSALKVLTRLEHIDCGLYADQSILCGKIWQDYVFYCSILITSIQKVVLYIKLCIK